MKTGAPLENLNAVKHGRRSKRHGFVICHMAREHRAIEARLHLLRKQLEREAREVHSVDIDGDFPARPASLIDLAVTFERIHQKAQHIAKNAADDVVMDHERSAVWAAQQRHRAIVELLTRPDGDDIFATLYDGYDGNGQEQPQAATSQPPAADTTDDSPKPDAPPDGTTAADAACSEEEPRADG